MDFGSEFLKKLDKAISRLRFAKFPWNFAKILHKFQFRVSRKFRETEGKFRETRK